MAPMEVIRDYARKHARKHARLDSKRIATR
jgi:hypothetical protein